MNTLEAKLITSRTGGMDTYYEQVDAWRMPKKIGKHEKITKRRPKRSEIKTEQQVKKNVTQKDEHGATMERELGKTTASRRGLTARRPLHTGNFQGRKTGTPRPSDNTLLLKQAQPVNMTLHILSKSKFGFENVRISTCESMPNESNCN
jgi:hypothetical protein